MRELLRVETSDKKYTVIQNPSGALSFLRYGKPWPAADRDFAHIRLILTLAYDLAQARKELEEYKAFQKACAGSTS